MARPPLGTTTTFDRRRCLVLALAAALALAVACGDDDGGGAPTATLSPEVTSDLTFGADGAMAHVNALAVDIGVRASGTDGERLAAEYIRDELVSYGYEAELQDFPVQVFEGVNVQLVTTSPEQHTLTPAILSGSASGNVEAPVAEAGIGRPEDFPDNTGGRIALIERGELTFGQKAANAQAAGASGVVVYNNVEGPFEGSLGQGEPIDIPVVAVSREDGLLLRDLIAGGVAVRLVVEAVVREGQSQNVVARGPGGECRVIAGGHYDSVPAGPGANDNASGTAVAIELARILAARGEMGSVCFVLFGSEEAGLVGSAYYVSQLSAEQRETILGMLNFDMLGVGTDWPFIGSTSMVDLAGEAAEALGISYRISVEPPGVGSDHASFIAAGIPAILFNCFCDPNYHTAADRAEFILPSRLEQAGGIGLGVIEALVDTSNG